MPYVSLSNKLDKEVDRRKPGEGTHRKVVGASVMDSELFLKVSQREERTNRIEAFLVFPVGEHPKVCVNLLCGVE